MHQEIVIEQYMAAFCKQSLYYKNQINSVC